MSPTRTMIMIWKSVLLILMATRTLQQQAVTASSQNQSEKREIPGVGLSIVFIFGGLLYGGFLKAFSVRFKIPYNPLLLISGIVLGIYHSSLNFVGEAAKLISQVNPNGLLAIFLPALIFQSAFKSQWHMFKKQFQQNLILGIPCTLLAAFLIMIGIKLLIGYDAHSYSWSDAFLLGCILCCTDIFSFVSKLKEYGTPQKIISSIEGESLLNYCTCILIFQMMNEVVMNFDNYSVLSLVQLFVYETLGGIMFGLLFGFFAVFFLRRVSHDGILVVTLMVIFCYTIYMAAEFSVLRISGIVSIVTFGIFMGAFGKAHIVGEAELYMDSFWNYAVFVAETSIFLISGVFVGINVFYFEELVTKHEILTIFYIYLITFTARYVSILLFQSKLSKLGYGMQLRESFIIAYSGLKGAIGISFAMIVFQNQSYSLTMRNLLLLHVTGNSLLTLLINGATTPLMINFLKLSNLTKVEYKFFKEYIQSFKGSIEEKKNELKCERYLNIVDWQEIQSKIGITEYNQIEAQMEQIIQKGNFKNTNKFEKRQLFILEKALQESQRNVQVNATKQNLEKGYELQNNKFEILVEFRKRFIKNLKYRYWLYHEGHHTMPGAAVLLIQSANFDLDTEAEQLESWFWIKNQFIDNIKLVSQLRKAYIIGSIARDYLFSYISYCYDAVSSYIQANQEVREEFLKQKYVGIHQEAINLILNESEQNTKQAKDFLTNFLQPSFPEIEREVKTRKASFNLLLSFENIVNRYYNTGQLENNENDMLMNIIDHKKLSLELHNPKWNNISFKKSLQTDEVFSLLPEKILSLLEDNLSVFETFNSNEIIQMHSSLAKYIYFIRRGGCTAELVNNNLAYKQPLVVGDIFGYESLVSHNYHSTITTKTLIVVLGVKTVCISKIMDYFWEFEEAFLKKYLFSLLKMFSNNHNLSYFLNGADKELLKEIVKDLRLRRYEPGFYTLREDSIFFRGSVQQVGNDIDPEEFKSLEVDSKPQNYHKPTHPFLNEFHIVNKIEPLTIFEGFNETKVLVRQKSSFLIGHLQLADFENSRYMPRLSSTKKKRIELIETPSREPLLR